MPLVKLQCTNEITTEIMQCISDIIKHITGKPEAYIMVTADQASVLINRESGTGAFIDVRGVGGLDQAKNDEISKQISYLLKERLNIDSSRIYLNFTEFEESYWGHGGVAGREPGTF